MRWWMISGLLCAALLFIVGCDERDDGEAPPPPSSIIVFRYDAARDVVIANTYQIAENIQATPQRYAEILAQLPEVTYRPTANIRLASPQATVEANTVTVDYRDVANLQQLSSAQAAAALAALEAWFWVPGVNQVRLLAEGTPLTVLGPVALTQPLRPTFHTYVVQPTTGEVGYLTGSLMPATLQEAVQILQRREISTFPAERGFRPLLPPDVTLTAETGDITNSVLRVNLSANFPRNEVARLAGIVLMLTQYPAVDAVSFRFGGQVVNQPFMGSNLNANIRPYDLLMPRSAALASPAATTAIRSAAETALGRKTEFEPALEWQDLALITTREEAGTAAQTVMLRKQGEQYTVLSYGPNLSIVQLLEKGVSTEAVTAFRLPGWENLALTQAQVRMPVK